MTSVTHVVKRSQLLGSLKNLVNTFEVIFLLQSSDSRTRSQAIIKQKLVKTVEARILTHLSWKIPDEFLDNLETFFDPVFMKLGKNARLSDKKFLLLYDRLYWLIIFQQEQWYLGEQLKAIMAFLFFFCVTRWVYHVHDYALTKLQFLLLNNLYVYVSKFFNSYVSF